MIDRLIVGFDGSASSRDAVALARRLALDSAGVPTVTYVAGPDGVVGDPEADRVLDEARSVLEDVPGTTFEAAPGPGVARALHLAAEHAGDAAIVLGAGRRRGVGRLVLGTTADAVVHDAPCPVAIAPAGYAEHADRRPPRLIAAAVDGGPDTERIARVAGRVAARAGATLRLITVAEVAGGAGPTSAGTIGYVTWASAARDGAADALDRAARAAGAGVTVERRVAGGRVAGAVARLSEGADLLVIGSRGGGRLRRVAAGTHTGRILHAASTPVLVLPRGTSEQLDDDVKRPAAASAR